MMSEVSQKEHPTRVLSLHPEIWHVEDEFSIANALKRKLQTPIRAGHRLLIPGYKIFTSREDMIKSIDDLPDLSLLKYKKPIIDINLGANREGEGFDVIKIFKKGYKEALPIIYSANTREENKALFTELGGDDAHFIEKLSGGGGLRGDAKIIKNCIQEDLNKRSLEEIRAPNPHLLVANGKYKNENYKILGAYISKLNLTAFTENKSAYGYLFDFWTHRLNIETHFLPLYKNLWTIEVKDELFYHLGDFIAQISSSAEVEGLIFQLQGKHVHIFIPDFETLENARQVVYDYIGSEDNLPNRLIDFLMSQRMLMLYIKGSEAEQKEIIEFARELRFKESQIAFDCGLWEAKAKKIISQNSNIALCSPYPITDLYYCEVEELRDTEALIRMDTVEPEGESVPVFKILNLNTLHNCGIYNVASRFKLSLYQTDNGGGYMILPTPPNIDF